MVAGERIGRVKVVNVNNVVQVGAAGVVTNVRAVGLVNWWKFGSCKSMKMGKSYTWRIYRRFS